MIALSIPDGRQEEELVFHQVAVLALDLPARLDRVVQHSRHEDDRQTDEERGDPEGERRDVYCGSLVVEWAGAEWRSPDLAR